MPPATLTTCTPYRPVRGNDGLTSPAPPCRCVRRGCAGTQSGEAAARSSAVITFIPSCWEEEVEGATVGRRRTRSATAIFHIIAP
jgi:hypothetical protein